MITDVGKFKAINSNYQVQCPNFKFKGTTNYANCTNHLVISIRVISAIVVVQSSNHNIQSSNFKFNGTTDYANCTNHLAISIRVISAIRSCSMFVVLIIKFNVQTSNSKGLQITRIARISRQQAFVSLVLFVVVRNSNHNIQSSNLNVQRTRDSNHKVQSSNLNVQRTRDSNHKVQSSNLNVQRTRGSNHKVQTSMFKEHCLYLWWSLTLMLGEEATAVSIEKFFECFNL